MATATSPAPEERSAKRSKPGDAGSASQPPPDEGPPGYNGRPPPMYHYPPGGGHPPPPHGHPMPGYMGGMPPYGGQYGGHWGPNHPGPPGHMYPGSRPPHHAPHMPPGGPPDRQGWNHHYRNPPPPPGASRNGAKEDEADDKYMKKNAPPPQVPPYGPGGWGHAQSWQHQGHYGPPPPGYGGPPPPPMPHQSPGMYNQPPYGGSKSPTRPRGAGGSVASERSDLYGRPPSQQGRTDVDISYLSTSGAMSRPMMDDDGTNSSAAGSQKDKGRGSYKCGRCGVPKKGHVCPYQPKLKRRPDQPPPVTRHAAVQVEMDEFMTLRRLNIRIQGFPESYATEPYMMVEDIVGGEPRHVTDESVIPPGPPPDVHVNASPTTIPHDGRVDETMEDAMPREPAPSHNGSRPSSTSRDMGVGDDPISGMDDVVEVAGV